jgi:hypothetical protein
MTLPVYKYALPLSCIIRDVTEKMVEANRCVAKCKMYHKAYQSTIVIGIISVIALGFFSTLAGVVVGLTTLSVLAFFRVKIYAYTAKIKTFKLIFKHAQTENGNVVGIGITGFADHEKKENWIIAQKISRTFFNEYFMGGIRKYSHFKVFKEPNLKT